MPSSLLAMTSALGTSWLDASHIIENFGLLGIMTIVFAECGLLVGFFLLHVVGALYHQFFLKDSLFRRMWSGSMVIANDFAG